MKLRFILITGILCCSAMARADEPLPTPIDYIVYSSNKQCSAHAKLNTNSIIIYRLDDKKQEKSWIIPDWKRNIYLSNNCDLLFSIYDGQNLLAENDKKPSTIIVYVFRKGKESKKITLGDIYPNLDILPKTMSNFILYKQIKWDGEFLRLITVDDREINFDL